MQPSPPQAMKAAYDGMKKRSLRILTWIVMGYILAAFSWWVILLYNKNRELHELRTEKMKLLMFEGEGSMEGLTFEETETYRQLEESYYRQRYMILSEGAVFMVTLLLGLWLINRAYNREVRAARQQRNFLLSITHELKSPIASIQLIFDTFLQRASLPFDKVQQLSESGRQEVSRLFKLVSDLLLAARMETAYKPHLQEVNLKALLEAAANEITIRFPEITLGKEIPSDLPSIKGDKQGLRSVITNLLENAVKYSPEPASIKVRAGIRDQSVWFTVEDQGIGVPQGEKKRIFDKFYRAGNEDTRTTKGTGLGLYIVRQIVGLHGGKVTVADNQPRGAVFRVEIPR